MSSRAERFLQERALDTSSPAASSEKPAILYRKEPACETWKASEGEGEEALVRREALSPEREKRRPRTSPSLLEKRNLKDRPSPGSSGRDLPMFILRDLLFDQFPLFCVPPGRSLSFVPRTQNCSRSAPLKITFSIISSAGKRKA